MFKRFRYRIKKLFDFIKFGLKDHDYDYVYLFELEKYKINQMMISFKKANFYKGCEYDIRDMRICIKLIDIIIDNDYCYAIKNGEHFLTKYVNTKNVKRFYDDETYDIISKNHLNVYHIDEIRKTKALNLYYKIRKEKTTLWWY